MYRNRVDKLSRWVFAGLLSVLLAGAKAQPFAAEIAAFKKQDSIASPKNVILFAGSSSFRLWKNLDSSFPRHDVLNRGFGGSSLTDLIHYAGDVILPYQPKQLVIYCGENDLASSDTVAPANVLERFRILFYLVRKNYPALPVSFVSIKPSPSRQRLTPRIVEANKLIRKFLRKKKNTSFIDIYHKMLGPDGKPLGDLFVSDSLHMNARGYAIWQKEIEPYLLND